MSGDVAASQEKASSEPPHDKVSSSFDLSTDFRPPFSQSLNNSTPTLATRESQDVGEKITEFPPHPAVRLSQIGSGSDIVLSPRFRPESDQFSADVAEAQRPKPPVDEAENNFKPKTLKFWLIMLSNFVALFLVALDRTIIATAIPRITDDFGSLGDIGWYGSAYMLTTSASQLLFGRIYKFYSLQAYVLFCRFLLSQLLTMRTGSSWERSSSSKSARRSVELPQAPQSSLLVERLQDWAAPVFSLEP